MILKKYNDNYDSEFVNLMLDIQELMENFCKSDKLKINSWAKLLCIPTINIEFKKNRNLYAIKLLDNVLNGKLEEPFNKFAKDRELKLLDPILVKTQLSSKFLNEIKKYELNENFQGNENQDFSGFNNYYNEDKKINELSSTQNNFIRSNRKKKNSQNKILYVDYDNQFLLLPANHKRSKSSYKLSKFKSNNNKLLKNNNNFNFNINEFGLRPSDILLMKNLGNLPYRNKSNLMDLKNNNKYTNYEKYKLRSIISFLNDQKLENNEIILSQKREIDGLKKKISSMQLKVKKIYDSQK